MFPLFFFVWLPLVVSLLFIPRVSLPRFFGRCFFFALDEPACGAKNYGTHRLVFSGNSDRHGTPVLQWSLNQQRKIGWLEERGKRLTKDRGRTEFLEFVGSAMHRRVFSLRFNIFSVSERFQLELSSPFATLTQGLRYNEPMFSNVFRSAPPR